MTDRRSIEKIINETVKDYKKGYKNIDEASSVIAECTNLQKEIIKCFLSVMRRSNIIKHSFQKEKK